MTITLARVATVLLIPMLLAVAGCGGPSTEDRYVTAVTDQWTAEAQRAMAEVGMDANDLTPAALGWTHDSLVQAGHRICDGASTKDLESMGRIGPDAAKIVESNARLYLC